MPTVDDLASTLWAAWPAPRRSPYVVGLTGGVASGKSTLATALAAAFRALPDAPRVEQVNTDGFLRSNADLTARGLLDRKGYPETYDREALAAALTSVRVMSTLFPGYSHRIYDLDPSAARRIDPPDVLIVEGLGLDAKTPLDRLVYLDAGEADQEAWYVSRFMAFWEQGRLDDASFYARFRNLDEPAALGLAAMVWTKMNRSNLRDCIVPVRRDADLVVTKGADHHILSIARNDLSIARNYPDAPPDPIGLAHDDPDRRAPTGQ